MHFGVISPPVSGHLNPFGALGRELIARGHSVTLLHMQDLQAKAELEGLRFEVLGITSHPPGTLPKSLAQLGTLDGFAALRFTIAEVRKTTAMFLRDAPARIRHLGISALLVDQTEPAGGSLAEHLQIPFITVANALALNREPSLPPAFSAWALRDTPWARLRNEIGYRISDIALRPVTSVVAEYRRRWSLPPLTKPEQSFSKLAQISQQAPAFDYPRHALPDHFYYTGPLRRSSPRPVAFPWDRLDGRPLIYASLGTLQNGKEHLFRIFAEACDGLPVQLVMTHGGGLDDAAASSFPGSPLVVPYAPQLEVLARASLTLTHAGLNTVLDSLSCAVPMVAVPITYEQPAIAQRINWCGAGKTLPFKGLHATQLRGAIQNVLSQSSFRENASRVQKSIREAGGVQRAADIIECALNLNSLTPTAVS